MNNLKLTIHTSPVGKQRPKFSTRGGFVRTFTPKKTVAFENAVRAEALKSCRTPFSGSLLVFARFYLPITQSWSKTRQIASKRLLEGADKKPDLDNLMKSLFDGLNGIAYIDDKQIVGCFALKLYSDTPRVEVQLVPFCNMGNYVETLDCEHVAQDIPSLTIALAQEFL